MKIPDLDDWMELEMDEMDEMDEVDEVDEAVVWLREDGFDFEVVEWE